MEKYFEQTPAKALTDSECMCKYRYVFTRRLTRL